MLLQIFLLIKLLLQTRRLAGDPNICYTHSNNTNIVDALGCNRSLVWSMQIEHFRAGVKVSWSTLKRSPKKISI